MKNIKDAFNEYGTAANSINNENGAREAAENQLIQTFKNKNAKEVINTSSDYKSLVDGVSKKYPEAAVCMRNIKLILKFRVLDAMKLTLIQEQVDRNDNW